MNSYKSPFDIITALNYDIINIKRRPKNPVFSLLYRGKLSNRLIYRDPLRVYLPFEILCNY